MQEAIEGLKRVLREIDEDPLAQRGIAILLKKKAEHEQMEQDAKQVIAALESRIAILEGAIGDLMMQMKEGRERMVQEVIESLGKQIKFRGGRAANVRYGDVPPEDLMQKHPFQK